MAAYWSTNKLPSPVTTEFSLRARNGHLGRVFHWWVYTLAKFSALQVQKVDLFSAPKSHQSFRANSHNPGSKDTGAK